MKTFSIKEAFKRAWEIWKENKMLLTLSALFLIVVEAIPNPAEDSGVNFVFEIILLLISTFVSVGWMKMNLDVENGKKVVFGDLFKQGRYFWRYFFTTILWGLIIGIGMVLFIVPGIYFALKYCFALNLIVDKDVGIKEAFRESAMLTDGVKWKLLGFMVVVIFALLLGVIALGVGIFVALPVVMLADVVVYRKLLAQSGKLVSPAAEYNRA